MSTEDLRVSNLTIQSHKGPYTVNFFKQVKEIPWKELKVNHFFLIDSNVFRLYSEVFKQQSIDLTNSIIIDASEEIKDLERTPDIIARLIEIKLKRNSTLVAIGGGITQDLTCFIASTVFRGIDWKFLPTTLLAQSDSCIGSKSSINVKGIKNLVGTFYPPKSVYISSDFLKTLSENEILSGIGEMIKVHIIEGQKSFDDINANFELILSNEEVLLSFIRKSLEIKKRIIEIDEFDTDYRNIMNYGHTYGHAIETATNYAIPHGIAVALGMDMANYSAMQLKIIPSSQYEKMHSSLKKLYSKFVSTNVNKEIFFSSIRKDKKNIGSQITVILPHDNDCVIKKHPLEGDKHFENICQSFFQLSNFNFL